jgi:hypothetical protein
MGANTGFLSYNDNLRLQRKLMHMLLGTKAGVDKYSTVQDTEVRWFLLRLLDSPERLFEHLET